MKKKSLKTVIAAVCVVAAGMGTYKAYNTTNESEGNMLLAENVEALSQGDIMNYYCAATANPQSTCDYACSFLYHHAYNIRYCW